MSVVTQTDEPSGVPDETTVTYAYSAEEHVTAIEGSRMWRVARVMQLGSAICYTLSGVAVGIIGWLQRDPSTLGNTVGGLGLGFAWWLAFPGIHAAERYRYRRQTPDGTTQTRRFSPHGFSVSPDGPLIPWGLISQVQEAPEAFLISDASSTSWISLPKRAFTDAQLAEFRSTIERSSGRDQSN